MSTLSNARAQSHRTCSRKRKNEVYDPILKWHGPIIQDAGPGALCYNYLICRSMASVEKGGRSACVECAKRLNGREFPIATQPKNVRTQKLLNNLAVQTAVDAQGTEGDRINEV